MGEILQSDIFSYVFEQFEKKLENLTNEKNLSTIIKKIDKSSASYELQVNDVWQYLFDKNGDQVVVDEKMYPAPSYFHMIFTVLVKGKDMKSVLRLYGIIARYLKDNPVIDVDEYNWHANTERNVYIEPIIRNADSGRLNDGLNGSYSLKLQYETYVGMNSLNGTDFVRARERAISGDVK